jgi:hypothetical protein
MDTPVAEETTPTVTPGRAPEPDARHAAVGPPYLRICLLALAVRIAMILPPAPTVPGPGADFGQYALRIAAGYGFGPSALLPPGYPFFLAASFRLLGPTPYAVALSQAILGALLTVPILRLAESAALSRGQTWLAGILLAILPAAVAETRCVTPVPLAACLFAAAAAFLLRAWPIPRFGHAVLAGILLGASILTRSSALLPAGLLTLAAPLPWRQAARNGPSRAEALLARGFVLALAMLATVPWSVRNGRVHHRPVLVETTWALRLRAATVPGAHPFATPAAARSARFPDNLVLSDNALAFWETAGYAVTHPVRAAGLWLTRCGRFLSPLPESDARGPDPYPYRWLAYRAAHTVAWSLFLTLLLAWLVLGRAGGARERALAWAALGFVVAGVLTGAVADARLLAAPLLAIPAARGLAEVPVVRSDAGRWRGRLFVALSAAIWALGIGSLLAG